MIRKKIDKFYVSDIDKFLVEFNATHPLSPAQQAEVAKFKKIAALRDQPVTKESDAAAD